MALDENVFVLGDKLPTTYDAVVWSCTSTEIEEDVSYSDFFGLVFINKFLSSDCILSHQFFTLLVWHAVSLGGSKLTKVTKFPF